MFDMEEYVGIYASALKDFNYKEAVAQANNYRQSHSPEKLYKFLPLDNEDKLGINERNLNTISRKEIYAPKFHELNDPFEFNAMFIDREKLKAAGVQPKRYQEILDEIKKMYYVLSFSTESEEMISPLNNMPMWAYYANNHQGICIEYEHNRSYFWNPVSYEDKRGFNTIILTKVIERYNKIRNNIIPEDDQEYQYFWDLLIRGLCIKHRSWKNENESRILFPDVERNNYGKVLELQYLGLSIKSIYIGMNCIQNKDEIKRIGKELGINVYEMSIDQTCDTFTMKSTLI